MSMTDESLTTPAWSSTHSGWTQSSPALDRLRIGDVEREHTCQLLARHYTDGRLTPLEFEERAGAAVQSTTAMELAELTADLPRLDAPAVPRPAAPAATSESTRVLRVLAEVGAFGITCAAMVCTLAVLVGMTEPALGILVAFGAGVSCVGAVHFLKLVGRATAGRPTAGSPPAAGPGGWPPAR